MCYTSIPYHALAPYPLILTLLQFISDIAMFVLKSRILGMLNSNYLTDLGSAAGSGW